MNDILQYLKIHGERLDTEIAQAVGISLGDVRKQITDLTAKGEVMSCQTTKFIKGKQIEGMSCRISGFVPPSAPGRKPKVQLKLS